MTERSYFWPINPAVGDAVYSPYNAEEFNAWLLSYQTGNSTNLDADDVILVVPGYLDDLYIQTAGVGTHSVVVSAGAAIIHNCFYISDMSISLPIDVATAGYTRKDSVVLRWHNQRVRVAVLKGAETTGVAVKPALTQTVGTWEVELAVIYVDGDVTYIQDKNIDDKRRFLYNNYNLTF